MNIRLDEIVERIITINHAWKLSRNEFGNDFIATQSFRETKASLQATLLREFSKEVYLIEATDSHDHDEQMYSVRLKTPIVVNGCHRQDVEHIPVRIAQDIFTQSELNTFIANGIF
jgi:hypothetical protein